LPLSTNSQRRKLTTDWIRSAFAMPLLTLFVLKSLDSIHESCPHCGKPLLQADGTAADRDNTARRACKSCRRRVGLCFICHQPVKGMYVWCPGCGHGGHLDHALQWFGGSSGNSVREVCPTGCGHKCNMLQPLSAFPRTEAFCQPVQSTDQINTLPPGGLHNIG
jgi:hypothetical protein